MRRLRIGSLFGIPIKLDVTFLLVLPIIVYLIGSQIEALVVQLNGSLDAGLTAGALTVGLTPWIVGTVAAVGLFVGVVLHELGHSLTAMRYGYPIDSITLWIFGGIAQLSEMPEDWKQEFTIAVAGPIVSVLVGVACYAAFTVTPASLDGARFVLAYLATINVALAVFNMLPAFPMDGGRVLRALLARGRPYAKATERAAEVGKIFAILMGLFGLFTSQWLLIGIAFFIYIAATSEARQVMLTAAFEGVTVRDVMTDAADLDTVDPDTSISGLLDRMFSERHTGYPVVRDGALVGLVTLDDAQEVKPVERDAYTVSDVMTTDVESIVADADAMDAFEAMQQGGFGRLIVTDQDGELVGLISRTDLMTALNIIQQSGAIDPAQRAGAAD